MLTYEMVSDISEALEKVHEWSPVYKALLRVCKTKEEAMEALKYIMSMEEE